MMLFMVMVYPEVTFAQKSYYCKIGNNSSICDQEVTFNIANNKLASIKVFYVGDCAGQGPFLYKCHNKICQDKLVTFKFINSEFHKYLWSNKDYGMKCEFHIKELTSGEE